MKLFLLSVALLATTSAPAEVWKRYRCEARGPAGAAGSSGPMASQGGAEEAACRPCIAQSPSRNCRLSCEAIVSGNWRPILGNKPNCR